MDYNIVITADAEADLDGFIQYLLFETLNNFPQSGVNTVVSSTLGLQKQLFYYHFTTFEPCHKK